MAALPVAPREPVKAVFDKNKFKIDYDQIELDKLHCPRPSAKSIPGKKDSGQTYLGSSCEYVNGELNEKPTYTEFRFQGPIMSSKVGIKDMVDEKTQNVSYAIYTPLPQSDEDIRFFTRETLDGLHDRMCEFAVLYAEDIGKPEMTLEGAKSMIPKLYKYRKDKITNKFLKDKDPFISNKLVNGYNRTLFVGLDGHVIPWPKLMEKEMKFIPVYSLGFYSGGMGITFPMKMVEAIVLSFADSGSTSCQEDTIAKYRDQYMEEYKKSIEAMSKMAMGDGLADNESTLGLVQQTAAPARMAITTENPEGETSDHPPIQASAAIASTSGTSTAGARTVTRTRQLR